MALAHAEPYRAASVTELALSNTVLHETNARGWKKLAIQVIFAGYTAVTVKVETTLDGSTWSEACGFTITATGTIIAGEIGPMAKIRIVATATLSGGTDTLEVWLGIEKAPV